MCVPMMTLCLLLAGCAGGAGAGEEADAAAQSARGRARLADIRQAQALLDALEQEDACLSLRDLAIGGDDLCALGLHGRAVGAALNACLDAVVEEKCPNEHAALLAFVRGAGQAGNKRMI